MKCANCGLPLSPARTRCPRCGTAAGAKSKAPDNARATQYVDFAADNVPLPQQTQGQQASSTYRNTRGTSSGQNVDTLSPQQTGYEGYKQTPLPDTFLPPLAASASSAQTSGDGRQTPFNGLQQKNWEGILRPKEAMPFTHNPQQSSTLFSSKQPTKLRLTIAGLCVFSGGLILFFVYFMARGLPATTGIPNNSTPGKAVSSLLLTPNTSANQTATAGVITTPDVSPATTYPGQKYIDSARTASAVNTYTSQPIQSATMFKVYQLVYVTFSVHTGGISGAACIIWYLNHNEITTYNLDVGPSTSVYSYARLNSPGAAYVEIYWASTKACTDKVLAQHVDFTVIG